MSCYHRYYPHGCEPLPPPLEWYDAYGYRPRRYRDDPIEIRGEDLEDEEEWPRRRRGPGRGRRGMTGDPYGQEEVTAASLQAQAAALREQLTRIEADLKKLAAAPAVETEP